MNSLTSDAGYKSIGTLTRVARAAVASTLITVSGISAYAQDSGFDQNRFYHQSAESHKILSFKFDESGVDEKSVSFLESQKEIDFKNSIYSGTNRASISQEDRNFLIKKSHISESSPLKNSLEPTAGLSKGYLRPASASSILNSNLERFQPRNLVAIAQEVKTTPNVKETPLFPGKNSPQYADAGHKQHSLWDDGNSPITITGLSTKL